MLYGVFSGGIIVSQENNRLSTLLFYWVLLAGLIMYIFHGPPLLLAEGGDPEIGAYNAYLLSGGSDQVAPMAEAVPASNPLLAFQASTEMAEIGDVIQFTLTVTNTGNALLENYSLSASLPESITYLPHDPQTPMIHFNTDLRVVTAAVYDLLPGEATHFFFEGHIEATAPPKITIHSMGGSDTVPKMAYADIQLTITDADPNNQSLLSSGDSEEGGWVLRYNEPMVSTFSGAATYNYPISVPPGRNGLQPALNLSYNSKRVDGIIHWRSSEWVGLGWSIDAMDIVRSGVERSISHDPNAIAYDNEFQLLMNGTSYRLHPCGG
jgi:uncharacterized repeat protein (TIGR01451 family)